MNNSTEELVKTKIRTYKDATAIVTGAASGIGLALVYELVKQGCTVVLADMQLDVAEQVANSIVEKGGKAWARELNVSDSSGFESLVKETKEKTGRLDYVFNNAGIVMNGGVKNSTIEDWTRIMDTNFYGVVNGVLASYPIMIEQGYGHIVNTSSIGGIIPTPGAAAYTASKFAVSGLSQSLRVEADMLGVRVSALFPGTVNTPLLLGGKYGRLAHSISPERIEAYLKRLNPVTPESIAPDILKQVAKNKGMIIVPGRWKRLVWLYQFSWNAWYKSSCKRFRRTVAMLTAAVQEQQNKT